jgi:hypothetical protein
MDLTYLLDGYTSTSNTAKVRRFIEIKKNTSDKMEVGRGFFRQVI